MIMRLFLYYLVNLVSTVEGNAFFCAFRINSDSDFLRELEEENTF